MTDKLQEICEVKRAHVAAQKEIYSFADRHSKALSVPPPRGFIQAIMDKLGEGETALIAEIKKASPSAGLIRKDFDPMRLAQIYAEAGATCLSVLTDEHYFQGHNDYVRKARAACRLPILRKDFIIDLWQVAESRAIGADCILLIMAALPDEMASELHTAATNYGMDVLIEVHDEHELTRALALPSGLIGINNRNLKTLQTDLATTERLLPMIPQDRIVVCESGIRTRDDVERMKALGVNCFLVGESLMKAQDLYTATRNLLTAKEA